ncbi:hypothetical protein G6F22_021516 [Rhizopus arrhizus]|nr:hypothetical protein G6F22_021516 [Rhizopus arrhizus]
MRRNASRRLPPQVAARLATKAPINMEAKPHSANAAAALRALSAASLAFCLASSAAFLALAIACATRRCATAGSTPVCAATTFTT